MTISDIKQWIVSADKLARPINNLPPLIYSETFGFGDPYTYENDLWKRFEQFAQQHTLSTDLEPGIYDVDKVEVICKHLSGIEWPYENTGREIKKSIAINVELRLKQQPKTLENDIIHESAKKFANDKGIPITGTFYEVFMGGYKSALRLPIQPLNPNANAIKVIEDRKREIKAKKLYDTAYDGSKQAAVLKELNQILKLLHP